MEYLQVAYVISERRACQVLILPRASHRYRRLCVLLQREGWSVNHKRVYRLYS